MDWARQALEVAQHLKTCGPQATGLDRRHRRAQAARVAHHIAGAEHHLGKTGLRHGSQLGLQGAGHGDGVHADSVKRIHHGARPQVR
jgi:hypothetical protein